MGLLNRFITWRAERTGVNWVDTTPELPADPLTPDERREFARLARELEKEVRLRHGYPVVPGDALQRPDTRPSLPRRRVSALLVASWACFLAIGTLAGIGLVATVAHGEWRDAMLCAVVMGGCAYVLVPALRWTVTE